MDENTFQAKLTEIMSKIKELPENDRGRLVNLAEQTKQRREKIRRSVGELQEALDYLRLSVKYLVFDLEATRRENAYLRKLVEQSNRNENRRDSNRGNDNFLEDDRSGAD